LSKYGTFIQNFFLQNLGDFGGSCYESHLDLFLLPSGKKKL
jgi:hypothetical protein